MDLSCILDEVSPTSLLIALTAVIVAGIFFQRKNNKELPPGPSGVPLLGYWPFIRRTETHLQLDELKRKYGDVYSFWSTGRLYVHLGTLKTIREANITKAEFFTKKNVEFNIVQQIFGGGVLFLNSESWKVNRKFFLTNMKQRGLLSIQTSISGTSLYDSIANTVEELHKLDGQQVDAVQSLALSCNTTMKHTIFGETGLSAEVIEEISSHFTYMMGCVGQNNVLSAGKIARFLILPFTLGYHYSKVSLRKVKKILHKTIEEHKASYDEDNIRDIIDDYIRERNVRRIKGDPTAKYFTDETLIRTLIQVIGDGTLSMSVAISLTLKAAAAHPEEQEKVYQELVEVVGLDRNPSMEDKSNLTYTNAFIQEALRTSSDFFAFLPSLECTKETTLQGYRIPTGAITITNFYTAHRDPETYQNPEKFDPTRFIAKEGKQKEDLPITFGVGKRACIGESYTMLQILMFMTTIIKHFQISSPGGVQNSNAEVLRGGTMPLIYKPRIQK